MRKILNNAVEVQTKQDDFFERDLWADHDLGLTHHSHDRTTHLTFRDFKQDWLKNLCKKFIKYSAATKRFSSLKAYVVSVRMFSRFLAQYGDDVGADVISRELILEYIHYLNKINASLTTRHQRLVLLRAFFEVVAMNQWLDVSPFLFRPEDFPKTKRPSPRNIPEVVLQQLNEKLEYLPEPIMRMVLILQETGLRIGELCSLPRSCIEQDSKGDWFLRYNDWKMNRKGVLKPISMEIAKVIQEQQYYINSALGSKFKYLFCANAVGGHGYCSDGKPRFSPVAKTMPRQRFSQYLQRLAKRHNITDTSGEIWHFQSHQFRHTVGTRMINSGVPPHIIQRYLGHDSPEMTMRYAHIHDDTLKRELADYLSGKVVDISGEVARSTDSELDTDELQWMKRNVLAQALPNGSCARPIAKGPCPHANACLTCGDFRTTVEFLPQHKQQLESVDSIISKAEAHGWTRQVEMNRQMKKNLLNIINSLEEDSG